MARSTLGSLHSPGAAALALYVWRSALPPCLRKGVIVSAPGMQRVGVSSHLGAKLHVPALLGG